MKLFLRIIKFLILCLVLFIGVFYFILNTSKGTRLFIQAVTNCVPGKLNINQVDGVLASSFTLKNVAYYSPLLQFEFSELNVKWRPITLLQKKITIESIEISNLETNITVNKDKGISSKKVKAPNFSLAILNHININHLHISNYIFNKGHKQIYQFKFVNLESRLNHPFYLSLIGTNFLSNEPLKVSSIFQRSLTGYKLDILKIYAADAIFEASGIINEEWNVKWRLNVPMLTKLFPEIYGRLLGQGNIIGTFNQPIINANIEGDKLYYKTYRINHLMAKIVSPLKIAFEPHLDIKVEDLFLNETHFNKLDLSLQSKQNINKLDFKLRCDLGDDNFINGKFSLLENNSFTNLNQKINGNLFAKVTRLQTVITAIPETKNLRGELTAKINLSGTLINPEYTINFGIEHASIEIPTHGVKLTEINLTGKMTKDLQLKFAGSLLSGKGTGNINGKIALDEENYPIILHLKGNELTVYNTPEYKVIATPNVNLVYNKPALKIKGDIFIHKAKIKPKDFSSTITLPNEVTFIHEKKNPAKNSNLILDINLNLGDQILIAYQNLNATITGHLAITQQKDSLATATGEIFTLKGKYMAYGKSLNIAEGHLSYTGNLLTNPGLNIRAIKEIRTIESVTGNTNFYSNNELEQLHTASQLTVGLQVKGTLKKPLLSFFSEPMQLSQADIISYIVFGYPQSRINKTSSLAVLNSLLASKSDGKVGIKGVTKNIKNTLGLNELRIGNTEYYDPDKQKINSGTSLTIGKKLGRRLSINYTTGVFNSVSILELRYHINKHLVLKSSTSSLDTGGDLVYEVEQN